MKKPSKKIITLIVIALLIISLSAYNKFHISSSVTLNNQTPTTDQYSNVGYTSDEEKNVSALDSDGDGLPDWQEIITNTDPHKTDTDGDGTPDGKELELGRDPTIAGPSDKLDKSKTATSTADTSSGDMTISEEVSKNLFANAVYLSNNNSMTDDNVNTLVSNLVDGVQNNFTYKEYTASNFTINPSPTDADLRFFASTFVSLQIQLLGNLSENTEPEAMASIYNNQAASLYEVSAPGPISDTELEIINNFSKVGAVFDTFSKQSEDPLKLPLAVKAYQDAANTQADLVRTIGRYLDKNGIIDSLDGSAHDYWTLSITE
ncbi:MAG: hypothetical protein V4509_02650 [Patescibacteria group bacterium]